MKKNDIKIKKLISTVDTKRKALGDKPRAHYITNGVLELEGTRYNLNILNMDSCVSLVSKLLSMGDYIDKAMVLCGTSDRPAIGSGTVTDWIEDVKLRASIINWDVKDRELKVLEAKLKDLRSEDSKVSDELSDIESLLS